MNIKNSLKTFLGYLKYHYPRQKFAIGSFLIVVLLGFLSVRALATSDHLVKWAPNESNFYLHLKIQKAEPVWQKIKELKLFNDFDYSLAELVPPKSDEIAIFYYENNFGLLILTDKTIIEASELKTLKLDQDTYLISAQEFPALTENSVLNIAASHSLGQESLSSAGFLYINNAVTPASAPQFIAPWQNYISGAPQAWTLEINGQNISWKNQKSNSGGSTQLRSLAIPQNTLFWTHGNNWERAWQSSLDDLPGEPDTFTAAAKKFSQGMAKANTPDSGFMPLFNTPYDLFIQGTSEAPTYTLKLQKPSDDNPIWLNNFKEYWLKQAQKQLPVYSLMILPDGSRAVEMSANEMLDWQEQNITNTTIYWLKNHENEFIIGYIATPDDLIISNSYANLVDFIYPDEQNGWLKLESMAQNCGFNLNQLESYTSESEYLSNISQILSNLGPYLVSTGSDICHI